MRKSVDRILTTHVGSLPAPKDLWTLEGVSDERIKEAAREVVQSQRDCGVDIVNEGEVTKGGNWVVFINERLKGFEAQPARATLELLKSSADWADFSQFYEAALAGGTLFEQTREAPQVQTRATDFTCTSKIEYIGQAALARE